MPFWRSQSWAFAWSPSQASRAFLQSPMPAPVFSRSSFTICAEIVAMRSLQKRERERGRERERKRSAQKPFTFTSRFTFTKCGLLRRCLAALGGSLGRRSFGAAQRGLADHLDLGA